MRPIPAWETPAVALRRRSSAGRPSRCCPAGAVGWGTSRHPATAGPHGCHLAVRRPVSLHLVSKFKRHAGCRRRSVQGTDDSRGWPSIVFSHSVSPRAGRTGVVLSPWNRWGSCPVSQITQWCLATRSGLPASSSTLCPPPWPEPGPGRSELCARYGSSCHMVRPVPAAPPYLYLRVGMLLPGQPGSLGLS